MKTVQLAFVIAFASQMLGGSYLRAESPRTVEIRENQLFVDGEAQPQLYGAELQYFRLRGGPGRNIPREKVIALWEQALTQMQQAGMNALSFYIPWDFHEYAEGKFDFDGTVDEDGDGKPDYPSRDLFTFFKMAEMHGFKRIMVRPGPYINAEWGFLGFGAIPLWFHEKYPDSHMRNPEGLRTKLYDYHSEDFLEASRRWFTELHRQVLSRYLGRGKPIVFLQIDNETNFMWQSIFNHDYGPRAIERYQGFLKTEYLELAQVNRLQSRNWHSWEEIRPATIPGLNLAEDQDWYRFQDESIHSYLKILRGFWEKLGVREPTVLFTLAESYNALGHGLLPNFKFRNDAGATGMMTMNLYPKTYELPSKPLLNLPFKADHDTRAMDEASDAYLGSHQEWLLGPEIQGGWWRGIDISRESRQQTYLSTLGHGLKALFIYYFTEGDNWQSGWAKQQILPLYAALKSSPTYASDSDEHLPEAFWKELQAQVDRKILVGLDVRALVKENSREAETLYFDAALDAEAKPGPQYALLKDLGTKVIAPHADFLAKAVEVSDPVTLVKDTNDHVPAAALGIDSLLMNAEWSGGLFGYALQAGINPQIYHWGIGDLARLERSRVIMRQDSGTVSTDSSQFYRGYLKAGGTLINFLGDSLAIELGVNRNAVARPQPQALTATSRISSGAFEVAARPLFSYELKGVNEACESILSTGALTLGYRCKVGQGTFVQIGALIYDAFNSDFYADLEDVPARRDFMTCLIQGAGIHSSISIAGGGDRLVAFGRRAGRGEGLWITVKNGRKAPIKANVQIDADLFDDAIGGSSRDEIPVKVESLLGATVSHLSRAAIMGAGLGVNLPANGSEAYFLQIEK